MLRKIINFLVEHFYPDGCFCGRDFQAACRLGLEHSEVLAVGMAAAAHRSMKPGQIKIFTLEDVSTHNAEIGNFRITIERLKRAIDGEKS